MNRSVSVFMMLKMIRNGLNRSVKKWQTEKEGLNNRYQDKTMLVTFVIIIDKYIPEIC